MRLPRLRVRTLMLAVVAIALAFGLVRSMSPTRRWAGQVQPGNPSAVRSEAAISLGLHVPEGQREDAYRVLSPLVNDPDPEVRASAATALTRHPRHSTEVIPLLLGLLKDKQTRVRQAALQAIEQLALTLDTRSPQMRPVAPALVAVLDDPRADIRLEATRALYMMGQGQQSIPALVRLVREEHGSPRLGAMGCLLTMKTIPAEMEPTWLEMLASDSVEYRLSAAMALIQLGKARVAEPTLREMLGSPSPWHRLRAAEVLIGAGLAGGAIAPLRELARSEQRDVRSRADVLLHMAKDSQDNDFLNDPLEPK
jgi:HEAT repeat protein